MSPQTNYSQDMPAAVAGLQVDGRTSAHVVSAAAEEVVRFGSMVVRKSDDEDIGRLPGANVVAITEDGGTYTAGNGVAVVNGVTVTVAYNANKATTIGDLATAIAALGFVSTCTFASNVLTITGVANTYIAATWDVSGITGTMTISGTAYTSSDAILGLSTREAKSYGDARVAGVRDVAVCTLAGDAITTSDTITGTVNGVAIATVTYATSEANTLQLLCNELMKNSGVAAATYSGRIVTVTNNPGLEIQIALTVNDNALASVAPSFSYAYTKQSTGVELTEAAFLPTETMSVTRQGKVWVKCEENVSLGDTPYVRVATGTNAVRGVFRNDSDSSTCQDVSGTFGTFAGDAVQDPDGNYVAPLEVNLP